MGDTGKDEGVGVYTAEQLEQAHRALVSTISKCRKVQPKLREGTSQHTLLVRRIQALEIAVDLIERELDALERSR